MMGLSKVTLMLLSIALLIVIALPLTATGYDLVIANGRVIDPERL